MDDSRPSPTASLFAARAARDFGDGFAAVLLPVHLTALGCSAVEVGVLATVRCWDPRCSRSASA